MFKVAGGTTKECHVPGDLDAEFIGFHGFDDDAIAGVAGRQAGDFIEAEEGINGRLRFG